MGFALICCAMFAADDPEPYHHVVVYGGTPAGVTAAIQARRMGLNAIIVEPTRHIGGLSASGLGFTDSGDKAVIGGLAREFYQRIKKHYDQPSAWKFEKRSDCKGYRPSEDAMWVFEPSVAEKVFKEMLAEQKVEVYLGRPLWHRPLGRIPVVEKVNGRIQRIHCEPGHFNGYMFIDATYDGDLMAAAGVSYTVGRESNSQYGETLNGVQTAKNLHNHRFLKSVDPFIEKGNAAGGLLPGVEPPWLPPDGAADKRLQTFCYRMCLTKDPRNRKPFEKPAGYDEREYELLLRNFEAGDLRIPMKPDALPNHKTDVNNNGAVSTDFIGRNWDYPDASDERRAQILAEHLRYQQGLMWTLQHHPRVPDKVRNEMKEWGLAADEFPETGGWPHQIYVREARRLLGPYVHTELDCRRLRQPPTPVGMGSYNMDSHNCTRYVTKDGFVQNEGDIQVGPGGPYQISYDSLTPKKDECRNLLVPVCLSSSHIAYGSIRMEPVFMILGQSAGAAAAQALAQDVAVQDINRAELTKRLLADGQILSPPPAPKFLGLDPTKLEGIVIDDSQAKRVGFNDVSRAIGPFVGDGYRHDGASAAEGQSITFRENLAGRYEVRLAYTANSNRRKKVPVWITDANGRRKFLLDQAQQPASPPFHSLGLFSFNGLAVVEITNDPEPSDHGHVIADAVQFLPAKNANR